LAEKPTGGVHKVVMPRSELKPFNQKVPLHREC